MTDAEAIRLLLYGGSSFWKDRSTALHLPVPHGLSVEIENEIGGYRWRATNGYRALAPGAGRLPTLQAAKDDAFFWLQRRLVDLTEAEMPPAHVTYS